MSGELTSRVRGAMTTTAVAVAFMGLTQTGVAASANATPSFASPLAASLGQFGSDAPTGPDDPLCAQMPLDAICAGGPYWQGPPAPPPPPGPPTGPPTGPLDPSCMTNPADAACMGSPFLPQTLPPIEAPPPPIELPISPPPMELPSAGMGGMPGHI
jgi:hypothetical protein